MRKSTKQDRQTQEEKEIAIAKVLESDVSTANIDTSVLANQKTPLQVKLAELSKRDLLYQIKVTTPIGTISIPHYGKAPNLATIKSYLQINYPQYLTAKVEVSTYGEPEFSYTPDDQLPYATTQFGSIYKVTFTYTKFFFFRKTKTIIYLEQDSSKPVSLYKLLRTYPKVIVKSLDVIGKVLPAAPDSLAQINGALINAKTNKHKY